MDVRTKKKLISQGRFEYNVYYNGITPRTIRTRSAFYGYSIVCFSFRYAQYVPGSTDNYLRYRNDRLDNKKRI